MVAISKLYDPNVYDNLGEISIVHKTVTEAEIIKLGDIVLKYKLETDVVVIIAHRHFDLRKNEAMLEKAEKDAAIARPAPLEEIILEKANVIALGPGNIFYPVNFSAEDVMPTFWTKLLTEHVGFLEEVADYLVLNNLAGKLMLGAHTRKSAVEGDVNYNYLEENYMEDRASVVRAVAQDHLSYLLLEKNAIKTTFAFVRGSKMVYACCCTWHKNKVNSCNGNTELVTACCCSVHANNPAKSCNK